VRTNVVLAIVGAALVLAGVALWSVPAALILAGTPCIALALLREEQAKRQTGAAAPRRHRRTARERARSLLRVVPPLGRAS
jgi:hypothetical protein